MLRGRSVTQIAQSLDESESHDSEVEPRVPSFPEIYGTYFDFVWSTARYMGISPTEMADVTQEVFITIYRRIDTLQRPDAIRSWIYGIIRRIVSTHHRTKRTALITTNLGNIEPEVLQPEWATPQRLAEQSEQARLLGKLLDELDTPKREIIVLADLEEMTAPEIAEAIGIPLNTVYSRLRIARQELEQALQRYRSRNQQWGRACGACRVGVAG